MYPLVSIALCCFNGEKYLKEQLDSLVNQDYPNIEIIAVDDCSNDATVDILNNYSLRFPSVKVFVNESNLGYKGNFEKAIQLCEGDYIALSDQDDIWDLTKVSKMVKNIGDSILIYHDSLFVDQNGLSLNKRMSDVVNFYDGLKPEAFLFFNCISSHALLFEKSLKEKLVPFSKYGHHDAWIAYVAANVGNIKILKEDLVFYRQHVHSATDILKRKEKKKERKSEAYLRNLWFLEDCSKVADFKNRDRINELLKLYSLNSNRLFNFKLFGFLLNNLNNFFPIYKKNTISKLNFAFKQSKKIKL